MIEKHLNDELPFMATENILMEAVKKGGNRQTLHEEIRRHSMAAGAVVKVEGKPNDLVERIAADPMFSLTLDEIKAQLKPENFIGRAPQQVTEFIEGDVKPVLENTRTFWDLRLKLRSDISCKREKVKYFHKGDLDGLQRTALSHMR